MQHTWNVISEGGEHVRVTMDCKHDEVVDAPLTTQYLIDLLANARNPYDGSKVDTWVEEEEQEWWKSPGWGPQHKIRD